MSAYPLFLEGTAITALVVGGGAVATRKVKTLVAAGARVHVVAPDIQPELERLAANETAVQLTRERYSSAHIADALLVIAATDDDATNSRIAADARRLGRLVNVVGDPEEGNCVTPAVHRVGDVVLAVTAGGVPSAAARIRDELANRLDARYADAIRELSSLRRALLDDEQRDRWSAAAAALIGEDFCDRVESGTFREAMAAWR